MAEQQSWYDKYPDYRVDLLPGDQSMTATFGTTVVAVSDRPLVVRETKHDPVIYFPLDDVRTEHFTATEHHTFCPFKGEASYWTLNIGKEIAENVMWSYPEPFPEVAGLKGYAAFYSDRIVIRSD